MTAPTELDANAYRSSLIRSVPLVLAVPIVIGLAVMLLGQQLEPAAIVIGAAGWLIALALRAPVAIVAMRVARGDRERVQPIITGASGPAEELVRLAVLLVLGRTLPIALSVGLGWGAIEAVYSLANGAALLALMNRTDPEAEQARALLPTPDVLRADAPLWGVVERIWASLLHVAFTLLIAASPLLVVVTVIAHSATNVLLLRWAGRLGTARLEAVGAAWTAIMLGLAVIAWNALSRR